MKTLYDLEKVLIIENLIKRNCNTKSNTNLSPPRSWLEKEDHRPHIDNPHTPLFHLVHHLECQTVQ